MKIVRGRLTAESVTPSNLRYDAGTDEVQFSPDGGVTWVNTPSADPRHSPAFLYPPLTGDVRCDAAANMVKWIKDFLDSAAELLCAGATALAVLNAAIPLYELITGGALTLLAIVSEAAGGLFTLGCSAIEAAMDSDAYDALLCVFYCNIGSDGQVTADQLAQIETDVTANLNTTAGIIVNTLLSLQGEVGLSNAGVIGGQTGICDCACEWCYNFSDASTLADWVAHSWDLENIATWTGARWEEAGAVSSKLWISWTLSTPTVFTDAGIVSLFYGSGNASIWVNGAGTFPDDGTRIWLNGAIVGTPFPITVSRIDIAIAWAFNTSTLWVGEMQFSGTGDNPFGDDNC